MTRSLRRTATRRGKTTTATARALGLWRRGEAGTAETRTPPSQEAFRRTIEAGMCPWCGRGPFDVVALHTTRAHAVNGKELRELAGVYYSTSITSKAYHERRVEIAKASFDAGLTLRPEDVAKGLHTKRHLSPAAIELQRSKSAIVTTEQRTEVARAAGLKRLQEASERDADVAAAVRAGVETYASIAARHNIHPRTVRTIARRNGIEVDGHTRPARINAARASGADALAVGRARRALAMLERSQALVADFHAGASAYDLADREGVSVKAMRALLRKAGADIPDGRADPLRPRPPRQPKPRRACEIEGCDGLHRARGLCSAHYQREMKALQDPNG